jgi:short-chain fatty acids transporter
MIWHGGFSGSAPLMVATAGHFLEKEIGIIPVTRTLLSPANIMTRCALLVAAPALLALMVPREPARVVAPGALDPRRDADGDAGASARPTDQDATNTTEEGDATTLADRLQRSHVLALLGAALAALYVVLHFATKGIGGLDLNMIILVVLAAGLALHGTPARYARAVDEAAPGASGILLQFPFYFGIMGIMKGAGLITLLAHAFIAISESLARAGIPTSGAYSITTFVAASVVNTFVPSGGGQWTVQGPIAVEAAAHLGVPVHKAVLAVVYGDEFTNMIQPFWTLPILAITGLKASDILGYTALLMLLVTPIYVLGLLV